MPANYVLLERVEVGETAVSSITFNSIPQTGYTDLKVVVSGREVTGTSLLFTMQINGVATNQSTRELRGSGSSATSGTNTIGTLDQNGSGTTASTFGNAEVYIPNYTSANYKSYSIDSASENNATAAYMRLSAGLWSQTAAITSLSFFPSSGTIAQYSSFSLYGLAAVGTTPVISPKATGGSIIQTDGTYWYHAFLASGTFTPAVGLSCDYLVVAGGGAGGGSNGTSQSSGGGGAGGYRATVGTSGGGGSAESALSLSSGTAYTVTIGAGGTCVSHVATNGTNSVFSSITSTAGGKGGGTSGTDYAGAIGGSGGGGTYNGAFRTGAAGTTNQGYAGGDAQNTSGGTGGGGGGGGAGAIGGTGNTSVGGAGGAGVAISSFATATSTGVSNYYAGGGGASRFNGSAGAGGAGGAGAGGANTVGSAATANTGSGGGAGSNAIGGSGGSGIVIIRYAV